MLNTYQQHCIANQNYEPKVPTSSNYWSHKISQTNIQPPKITKNIKQKSGGHMAAVTEQK